jgi:hypothetical protein
MRVPPATWVLAAFLAVYLLFFVYPTYSGTVMRSVKSVPAAEMIGGDLALIRTFSQSWLDGGTPYTGLNIYPPLTAALFAPLLMLSEAAAFKLVTLVSIGAFITLTLVLPIRLRRESRLPALPTAIAVTGLVSYGFQLELERGQFNVTSVLLCYLAIWIFHHAPRRRWLAYALFVLGVQLKVYPLIFALLLVDDWRDWAGNIKRWLLLAAINIALLFALGPSVLAEFLGAMAGQVATPAAWVGNHSIRSYAMQMAPHLALLEIGATLLTAACLALVLFKAARRNRRGIDAELLLACTLVTLLLPPVSHDYKLALVAAPLSVLFADDGESWRARAGTPGRFVVVMMLMFALAAAYAATLVSYDFRPAFIDNSFPMVMAMLVLTAGISVTLDSAKS